MVTHKAHVRWSVFTVCHSVHSLVIDTKIPPIHSLVIEKKIRPIHSLVIEKKIPLMAHVCVLCCTKV